MMQTLKFEGTDLRDLFGLLIDAVTITGESGQRPSVVVNGRAFEGYELLKVAALMPDDELNEAHQAAVDAMFDRRQYGYRRTGYNLAHRANQIASDAKWKGRPKPPL